MALDAWKHAGQHCLVLLLLDAADTCLVLESGAQRSQWAGPGRLKTWNAG